MQIRKIVISFLLMLTYSFGFAHNLVPHCQEVKSVDNSINIEKDGLHDHEHHQHSIDDQISSDHEHFLHEGHYDEGLYDLFECYLNEMEHPAYDCNTEHSFALNTSDNTTKKLSNSNLMVVLLSVFLDLNQRDDTSHFDKDVKVTFSFPLLENSPHRGPPLFTC